MREVKKNGMSRRRFVVASFISIFLIFLILSISLVSTGLLFNIGDFIKKLFGAENERIEYILLWKWLLI